MSDTWEPILTIDPRRAFGAVCVAGTRIPAETVAELVAAGDSVDYTAAGFDLPADTVRLCCWWAVTAQEMINRRPTKAERSMIDAWADWAIDAAAIWGGWRAGAVADPPPIGSAA